MTIRLLPPSYRPAGPDGQGWNRLSLNAHIDTGNVQCALRPRGYPQLWESQDTRRARWGGFGTCLRPDLPGCDGCPVLTRTPRELRSLTPKVLARIEEIDPGWLGPIRRVWLMNRPEDGWSSSGRVWSWDDLARVQGWDLGDAYVDEHSEGFWLVAAWSHKGIYGVRAQTPS